jgi:hypothetical protein
MVIALEPYLISRLQTCPSALRYKENLIIFLDIFCSNFKPNNISQYKNKIESVDILLYIQIANIVKIYKFIFSL